MRLAEAPRRAPARARVRRSARCRCRASAAARPGWEACALQPFALPPVHLARDGDEAEALLSRHVSAAEGENGDGQALVLGMDTESRPLGLGGCGRLALLQLATPHAVVLVPLLRMGSATPPSMARLLASPALLCGVSSHGDADALANATCARGAMRAVAVDIATAATRHGAAGNDRGGPPRSVGLAALVTALGGPLLDKPKSITLSNWERWPLNAQQVSYAALDAFASGWAAAALHARLRAASAKTPPLGEWLRAEAATQAAERALARARAAAAAAALMEAARAQPGGQRWRELIAAARELLPGESENYLDNAAKKLIKRRLLLSDRDTFGVKPRERR